MTLASKLMTVGKRARRPLYLGVSVAGSTSSGVSYPAGVASGVVAIYVDWFYGFGSTLGTAPPTGYTSLATAQDISGVRSQVRVSFRILDGSESGLVIGTPAQATGSWWKSILLYDFYGQTPSTTTAAIASDSGALVTSSVDSTVATATYLTIAVASTDTFGSSAYTSIKPELGVHWSFPYVKVASGFRAPATSNVASAYTTLDGVNSCAMCLSIPISG